MTDDIDHELAHLREEVSPCFQCGTCAGGCPVFKALGIFNPRMIFERILLEGPEVFLGNNLLWHCSVCYTCSVRCPQGIDVAHVLIALKNLAVKLNYAPESIVGEVNAIMTAGATVPLSKPVERKRKQLGLPTLPVMNIDEYEKILKSTGAVGAVTSISSQKENQ